jgi:hypothetical protein
MKKNIFVLASGILLITLLAAFKITGDVLSIGSSLPKGDVTMKDIR